MERVGDVGGGGGDRIPALRRTAAQGLQDPDGNDSCGPNIPKGCKRPACVKKGSGRPGSLLTAAEHRGGIGASGKDHQMEGARLWGGDSP